MPKLIPKTVGFTEECLRLIQERAAEEGRDANSIIRYLVEVGIGLRRPPHVTEHGALRQDVSYTGGSVSWEERHSLRRQIRQHRATMVDFLARLEAIDQQVEGDGDGRAPSLADDPTPVRESWTRR